MSNIGGDPLTCDNDAMLRPMRVASNLAVRHATLYCRFTTSAMLIFRDHTLTFAFARFNFVK